MPKKGLGKGLGSLLEVPKEVSVKAPKSKKAAADPGTGELVERVLLEQVVPSPFQPRKRFNEEHLNELVESIREHGVIQPLIVRKVRGKYELIAGERRWRACQQLELDEVPVISRKASDRDVLEMALIENLQREDLDPLEEAEAYSRLSKEFDLTQEEIARQVGKNRATVANAIRLLDLDKNVQALVSARLLSAGHAKAILGLKTKAEQRLVADVVVKKKLNVRATEKLVTEQINGRTTTKKSGGGGKLPPKVESYIRQIQDDLRGRFSTNVAIQHSDKKGKIEIEYYGNEDLGRILELLGVKVD
ncbi:MAG: ParB/RepB/Spo0J family partition protein [Verrucomicrobiales bacterium]|nr:ParB/RepB/Spo0J family partition protein [Verrucomicrobiales bacterium]